MLLPIVVIAAVEIMLPLTQKSPQGGPLKTVFL